MNPIQIAQIALDQLLANPEVTRIDRDSRRVQVLLGDQVELLSGLAVTHRRSFDLAFLDFPRASKRQKVQLLTLTSDGSVAWGPVAHDDPDYGYRFRATILLYIRLIMATLAERGVVLAVANPSTYLAVRSSIEQFLGPEKFLGELVYQTRSGGGNDAKWMSVEHETLLVYGLRPESVARFGLAKSEAELRKYREDDAEGRFYWDTFIRKNARNHYPIRCPDGSTLELDASGNRISWLWREETFLEMLGRGEVEFRKFSDHPRWRLYYKDRLKEHKILRSLVLNRTELSEISGNVAPGTSGAALLTQDGSSELTDYSGEDRPEYLKSSRFFRFVLQVFGRGSRVLIPFPEFGSAVTAAVDLVSQGTGLTVFANPAQQPLLTWRVSGFSSSQQAEVVLRNGFPRVDITSPDMLKSDAGTFLELLASNRDPTPFEWHDIRQGGVAMGVGVGKFINLIVRDLPLEGRPAMPVDVLSYRDDLDLATRRTRVWSSFSRATISSFIQLPKDADYFQFPACAFK